MNIRSLRDEDSYGVDNTNCMRILNKDASNLPWVSRWTKYKIPTQDRYGTDVILKHVNNKNNNLEA